MKDKYPEPPFEQSHRQVPEDFNLAYSVCRRHRDAVTRVALIETRPAANNTYTFGALDFLSDKCATVFGGCEVNRGDTVAVVLHQSAAAAIAQLAALKLGALVVPLSPSLPAETLHHALSESNAKVIVIEDTALDKLNKFTASLTALEALFVAADLPPNEGRDFWRETNAATSDFITVETGPRAPAFAFYNESESREPAARIYDHGSLRAHFAAFDIGNRLDSNDEAIFWTPMDWASPASLLDMLYPALYHGCAVVAHASQIANGEQAISFLARSHITNLFINTDEFRAISEAAPELLKQYDLRIRDISGIGKGIAESGHKWARVIRSRG